MIHVMNISIFQIIINLQVGASLIDAHAGALGMLASPSGQKEVFHFVSDTVINHLKSPKAILKHLGLTLGVCLKLRKHSLIHCRMRGFWWEGLDWSAVHQPATCFSQTPQS